MAKDKIIIIGGKGTAVVVAEQIEDAKRRYNMDIEVLGFAFDDPAFGSEINGFPILCKSYNAYKKYSKYKEIYFIFQMYRSDLIRDRVILRDSYNIPLTRFYNFIHPSVMLSKSVTMGYGNTILANSVLDSNVVIGDFNTFYSNVLIAHDTVIGNSNFFAGHSCIGSNLKIDDQCFFGLNSSVRNFVRVRSNSIIGMGSNIIDSFEENNVIIGNPGRILRRNYE